MSTPDPTEKIPHAIKTDAGEIIADPTWFCEGDVIKSMIGWSFRHARMHGVLVQYIDGEWREKYAE